jgi:hypothetical protein
MQFSIRIRKGSLRDFESGVLPRGGRARPSTRQPDPVRFRMVMLASRFRDRSEARSRGAEGRGSAPDTRWHAEGHFG